ncbi:hypothetical protein BDC45DRAFT_579622 [Circinella umbellata]|nr:hypothetical protein BDC45DRAFT_579622 [Circinella umbellata]
MNGGIPNSCSRCDSQAGCHEVLQLTGPNEVAMMDTMVKIVDKFYKRLIAVWDARPNKTIKTFHGLTETASDKLAMDVSIYLKHHLDDIPIDLCEKNWVSLYLVYYLFEKHISTSQRSYMDTASEGGLSAVMSSTFFEDEDDNSIAANARITGILSDHKATLVFPLFRPPLHLLQNGREVKQMLLLRQIVENLIFSIHNPLFVKTDVLTYNGSLSGVSELEKYVIVYIKKNTDNYMLYE